ncbi:MAG: hypothetical protein AABW88_05700 [Nanoarchaeota archaeon]
MIKLRGNFLTILFLGVFIFSSFAFVQGDESTTITYWGESSILQSVSLDRGNIIYNYDKEGMILSEIYKNNPADNLLYTYYLDYRIKSLEKPYQNIKMEYKYDSNGNLIEEKISKNNLINSFNYEYDSENKLIKTRNNGNVMEYFYNSEGDLIKTTLNDQVIQAIDCSGALCEYFDGAIIYDIPIQVPEETLCDNLDDNNNGIIDEGCDQDQDGYVNKDMTCEGTFKSDENTVKVSEENIPSVINFVKGWNLVSFPTINPVPADDLISSCRANGGLAFNPTTNQYYKEDIMSAGKPYWIYASKNCEFDISQYGIKNNFEIEMQSGWNLVPGVVNLRGTFQKVIGTMWKFINGRLHQVIDSNPTEGIWVYWDTNKGLDCSRVDLDDLNSEVNR